MIQNKKKFLIHLLIVVIVVSVISVIYQKSSATHNSTTTRTPVWSPVGNPGFSNTKAWYFHSAIDSKNTPYVAFRDIGKNLKGAVMKYDGTKWINVGGSIPSRYTPFLSFDSKNTPYVAFRDEDYNDKLTVMKYDGTKWITVGINGFADATAISLDLNSKDAPYVAFRDYVNSDKVTLMKYNGTKWITVGAPYSAGKDSVVYLDFNSKDVPHIAFIDGSTNEIEIIKHDGTKWITIGASPGYSLTTSDISFFINSKDVPHVSFFDNNNTLTIVKYDSPNSKWVNVAKGGVNNFGISTFVNLDGTPIIVSGDITSPYPNDIKAMKYQNSSWISLGHVGFFDDYRGNETMLIDSDENLYYAFSDYKQGGKLTMMHLSHSWSNSGTTNGTSQDSEITSIITDSKGTKYLAYTDSNKGDKATVLKYDDTTQTWSPLGLQGFTPGRADWVSLATDSNDVPYIAFADKSVLAIGGNGKATVMKWDGAKWDYVGTKGFSIGGVEYTRLAIDVNDVPYITYVDNANGNTLTTMKYDTTLPTPMWFPVGIPGFTHTEAWYPSISFDSFNKPYVAYRDQITGKANVKMFNGANWMSVGPDNFTKGSVDYTVLKFDNNNTPYISFQDWDQSGKATVMSFNGSAWIPVGNPGFSKKDALATSMSFHNNIPYVAMSYGGTDGVSVMKYYKSKWINVGQEILSRDLSWNTQMIIDNTGVPFVSYVDFNNKDTVEVMKFD